MFVCVCVEYTAPSTTHILTASTKIAAKIKVMTTEVTSVIANIVRCSSKIMKQQPNT